MIQITAANAAKAYLEAAGLTTVTNFYASIEDPNNADDTDNNTRALPCVICSFEVGQEYPIGTGNFNGNLVFKDVGSDDDLTAAQWLAMFAEIFGKISTDTILADLSVAGNTGTPPANNFTAIGFTGGIQMSALSVEGGNKTQSIILPINCCPSDIS